MVVSQTLVAKRTSWGASQPGEFKDKPGGLAGRALWKDLFAPHFSPLVLREGPGPVWVLSPTSRLQCLYLLLPLPFCEVGQRFAISLGPGELGGRLACCVQGTLQDCLLSLAPHPFTPSFIAPVFSAEQEMLAMSRALGRAPRDRARPFSPAIHPEPGPSL